MQKASHSNHKCLLHESWFWKTSANQRTVPNAPMDLAPTTLKSEVNYVSTRRMYTKAHSVRTEQVLCSPHSFTSTLSKRTNRGISWNGVARKRTVTLALFPEAECWTKSSYETALLEWSTKVPSCDRYGRVLCERTENWRITQASKASVSAIAYSLYWIKLNAILKP